MPEVDSDAVDLLGSVPHHLDLDAEFPHRNLREHKSTLYVGDGAVVGSDDAHACAGKLLAGLGVAHGSAQRPNFLGGSSEARKQGQHDQNFRGQIHRSELFEGGCGEVGHFERPGGAGQRTKTRFEQLLGGGEAPREGCRPASPKAW